MNEKLINDDNFGVFFCVIKRLFNLSIMNNIGDLYTYKIIGKFYFFNYGRLVTCVTKFFLFVTCHL